MKQDVKQMVEDLDKKIMTKKEQQPIQFATDMEKNSLLKIL